MKHTCICYTRITDTEKHHESEGLVPLWIEMSGYHFSTAKIRKIISKFRLDIKK